MDRLRAPWEDASFAIIAVLACVSASLVSHPQVSVGCVSKARFEIGAAVRSVEPIMASIEDDDRELEQDDLQPHGLPGARLVSPLSHTLSQIIPSQSVVLLSVLTPAQLPLRC